MRDIQAAWGIHQPVMVTLGTLADADQVRMVIDVTAVESATPGGTYTIRMRRADGTVYEAASGLAAVNDGSGIKQVIYTLEQQDLARPGAFMDNAEGSGCEPDMAGVDIPGLGLERVV
ncbi:hypothetical protein FACS1894184_11720 [Clostridia bacterium]|nr:hypothetical protein FACS1894184_11720 [Clostridia bacterium]